MRVWYFPSISRRGIRGSLGEFMLHLSFHRGHIQLEILIKSRLGALIAFDQVLPKLLVEAAMKNQDEARQLFVKRGSASSQTDDVEARSDTFL